MGGQTEKTVNLDGPRWRKASSNILAKQTGVQVSECLTGKFFVSLKGEIIKDIEEQNKTHGFYIK